MEALLLNQKVKTWDCVEYFDYLNTSTFYTLNLYLIL